MIDADTQVQRWLHKCVLALDLCPFAAPVVRDSTLRIQVSDAQGQPAQLNEFLAELDTLQTSGEAEIATTLLAFSSGPDAFPDFLELVDAAQELLVQAGLEGVVQLAHFHPEYCFADEAEDDLSHYTNRAPLPIIHLLRENLMGRVLEAYPDPENIPSRNIERLRALGREAIEQRWDQLSEN